jgi:hypothetical protein
MVRDPGGGLLLREGEIGRGEGGTSGKESLLIPEGIIAMSKKQLHPVHWSLLQ